MSVSEELYLIPEHVAPDRVVDFDIYARGQTIRDPFDFTRVLEEQGAPDIFYTPRNGGHWVFRRYETVRDGFENTGLFTTNRVSIPPMEMPLFIPYGMDPPQNRPYRRLLNVLFAPSAIAKLQPWIRNLAGEIIERVRPQGHCDFVQDFSAQVPTAAFIRMLGMPLEELEQFVAWSTMAQRGTEENARATAFAEATAYLVKFLEEKQKNPDSDGVMAALVRAKEEDGTPLSKDTILGIALLLFVGGLDTVTNTMSLLWRRLAEDLALRRRLIGMRDRNEALNELLRVYATSNLLRAAKVDTEFGGAAIKKGDRILLMTHSGNRDGSHYEAPLETRIERSPTDILTFGLGVHRCVGLVLARTEIAISLDEWLTRIPDFWIPEGTELDGFVGLSMGYRHLPLEWSAG
jgi:cytochrome P450